jgi:hypothetical protein
MKRFDNLTADQKRYVILNADFDSYKNLIQMYWRIQVRGATKMNPVMGG